MTFAPGTKVRYTAENEALSALNGIEGVVTENRGYSTTMIKVTKGSDSGQHDHTIGGVHGFGTSNLAVVENAPEEFKVGDRVKVNDSGSTTHHGLVGVITEVGTYLGKTTVRADVDETCEAFKALQKGNLDLDGKDWYLNVATLELVDEKLKEGGAISYEQVERGQRIRVSYESKGVTYSREGIVGKVTNNKNPHGSENNWTINALDDEAERWGGKGQRLNWGSNKVKETIVLLENVPEVDAVLERLLESEGGTVIRAFDNQLLVREAFSDVWKSITTSKVYSSESLRRVTGGKITFFVEDTEGN